MFSINPDAHSTAEIDLIKWDVAMARKGGVPSHRVLNGLDLASFRAYLEARKVKGNVEAKTARCRASQLSEACCQKSEPSQRHYVQHRQVMCVAPQRASHQN